MLRPTHPLKNEMPCVDGSIPEPLDLIHYLFPNNGTTFVKENYHDNACWALIPFHLEVLDDIIPPSSGIYTSEGFVDSSICFVLSSCALICLFFIAYFIWNKLDNRFAGISPSHKKWYVVANMSKCVLLAIQCLSVKYWIGFYRGFALDEFRNIEYKRTSVFYVITDFVALLMVPKLPFSTILHHVTTVTLSFVVWSVDLHVKGWTGLLGVSKMLLMYGGFSTVPFTVNGYLALRVVYPKSFITSICCKVALVTYLLCCACNWSIHAVWLVTTHDISVFSGIYLLCVSFLINDDIILIKWLLAKNSPGNNR
jgi:hypothetical protein